MKKLTLVLVALAVFGGYGFSNQEVEALAFKARGNFEKFLASVKGFTVTTQTSKFYFKDKRLRVDLAGNLGFAELDASAVDGQLVKAVMIFGAEKTFIISTLTGRQEMPGSKEGMPAMRYMFEKFWWVLDLKDAKIDGEEKIDNRECYHITYEKLNKLMPVKNLWVDKNNLMLVKDEMDIGPGAIYTTLSEFKTISAGWEYPIRTKTEAMGKEVNTLVYNIDIKTEIPESFFDADKIDVKVDEKQMEMMKKMMQGAMDGVKKEKAPENEQGQENTK